ncbi:MAG: glucose 1-dehydrogenase [Geminicoccaceae bacterium]
MADLSLFDLTGRKALVTGASRGLGRAIAEGLAGAGAAVALAARTEADLADAVAAIATKGGRAVMIPADLTGPVACGVCIDRAVDELGGLDILVNAAGMEEVRPSLEVDEALWDRILGLNLKSAFFCAQAAAASMVASGTGGAILNVCSLTSEVGVPTAVPYGASKSGLLGVTRALAAEWAPHGIRVNGIAPGYFRTALTEVFYQDEAWQKAMLAKIPQRRFGKLEDVVGASVFLCSDASAYVTGQCLAIDGGTLAAL